MSSPARPLPIAVLISGSGTTLRNLLEKHRAGVLPVEFRCVISSNPQAGGIQFARDASVPVHVVPQRADATADAFGDQVFSRIREAGAELVVMGGFLKFLPIPPDFVHRVLNIHPALIPAFCGRGYYGERVHREALAYGVKVSGCTVHFVDNEYDHGPIVLQRTVPVRDDDTPRSLAERVFAEECNAYPEAIRLFASGRLEVVGRQVRVR